MVVAHRVNTIRPCASSWRCSHEIGGATRRLTLDLARPETIADALAGVGEVDHLVISAIEQSVNSLDDFDIADAERTVTIKLVAYAETVRAPRERLTPDQSRC
ncbi:hypothetical protein [Streptomyces sp. NBC_01320]|uniref:hypothetical protein n=1 Tax=Streptomyces sp. NBC_01320 TaxID=2903824 RepID=UPI002E10142F|nr:hypothetical protein OG395_42105 [Streptomyces sp. NBC_01320]